MLGTASMIMLDDTACTVRAMEVIARFYDHESCGQCSQCREGTEWLHQIFARLEHGQGRMEDVELLTSLANGMASLIRKRYADSIPSEPKWMTSLPSTAVMSSKPPPRYPW